LRSITYHLSPRTTEHGFLPHTEIIAGIVIGYFTLTWFFFGSSHPCGILEARQRPYEIQWALDFTDRRLAYELMNPRNTPAAIAAGTAIFQTAHEIVDNAPNKLKKEIARLTPAQCAWKAITWRTVPKTGCCRKFIFLHLRLASFCENLFFTLLIPRLGAEGG